MLFQTVRKGNITVFFISALEEWMQEGEWISLLSYLAMFSFQLLSSKDRLALHPHIFKSTIYI